jgi:hypothetical protein
LELASFISPNIFLQVEKHNVLGKKILDTLGDAHGSLNFISAAVKDTVAR